MFSKSLNPIVCLIFVIAAGPLRAAEPSSAPAGSSRIIKWVDEKGVTHYGDRLPPQFAGRDNSEINPQGVLIKRNKPGEAKTDTAGKESTLQERQDRALLAAYTKSDEIDLARDRNLQMDQAAIDALNQQKLGVQNRLNGNNKSADGFSQRKKPIPEDLAREQKANQAELAKIEQQIAGHNASMEATRQRFDRQKQRFIELKSGDAATASPVN